MPAGALPLPAALRISGPQSYLRRIYGNRIERQQASGPFHLAKLIQRDGGIEDVDAFEVGVLEPPPLEFEQFRNQAQLEPVFDDAAALPTTTAYGGTSFVTTAFAPMTAPSPMVTPARI